MRWRSVVLLLGGLTGISFVVSELRLRGYAKRVRQLLADEHGLDLSTLSPSDRIAIRRNISRACQERCSVEQAAEDVLRSM
jgi:hypothetical protein